MNRVRSGRLRSAATTDADSRRKSPLPGGSSIAVTRRNNA